MKKILLFYIAIFLIFPVYGQDSTISDENNSKLAVGVYLNTFSSSAVSGGYDYNLNIMFKCSSSRFLLGAILGHEIYDNAGDYYFAKGKPYKLNGISFSYQFNPFYKHYHKRVDFYFQYDLIYRGNAKTFSDYLYNYNTDTIEYKTISNKIKAVETYLAYGFKVKCLKRMYVDFNFGIGYSFVNVKYAETFYPYGNREKNPNSIRDFDLIIRLGIGYDINLNKKRD